MTEKEQFELIVEIAKRAEKSGLLMFNRMTLIMDLECATNEFNLRLNDFLNADEYNFTHDIIGIQQNLDRQNKKMENLFVPRFSNFKEHQNENLYN